MHVALYRSENIRSLVLERWRVRARNSKKTYPSGSLLQLCKMGFVGERVPNYAIPLHETTSYELVTAALTLTRETRAKSLNSSCRDSASRTLSRHKPRDSHWVINTSWRSMGTGEGEKYLMTPKTKLKLQDTERAVNVSRVWSLRSKIIESHCWL